MNVNRTTPRSKLNTTTSRGGGGGGINGFVSNRSSRRWLSHVFVAVCSFLLGAVYNNYDYEFSTPNDVVAGAGTARTSAIAAAPAPSLISFRDVATQTQTDKVAGYGRLPPCLEKKGTACLYPYAERETCRVWGHFYDTIYDRWLRPFADGAVAGPMQFLEIGYFQGKGFEAYTNYLATNTHAELHSMEISCIEAGPRSEGKWPWGNFAKKHRWYERLLHTERLHCGDANDYSFLLETWNTKMKRTSTTDENGNNINEEDSTAPPLMVVVDDGAHIHDQMATSLFFWLPRIHPGGILIMEDIQPISEPNPFRTHIVPQLMKDLHWCGAGGTDQDPAGSGTAGVGKKILDDTRCFPTLQPLIQGIHCEMHICVIVRNSVPASEPDQGTSGTPKDAFTHAQQCLFGPHST